MSVGLDVAGSVIEAVRSTTVNVCMCDEVFEPLGMLDTWFKVPNVELHRMVCPCMDDERAGERNDVY